MQSKFNYSMHSVTLHLFHWALSFIHSDSSIHCFWHSLIHTIIIYSFIRSFIHSFHHSFIRSLIHSLRHSFFVYKIATSPTDSHTKVNIIWSLQNPSWIHDQEITRGSRMHHPPINSSTEIQVPLAAPSNYRGFNSVRYRNNNRLIETVPPELFDQTQMFVTVVYDRMPVRLFDGNKDTYLT